MPVATCLFTTITTMSFLSSIADKAQNALKQSSISQHIPPSLTGSSPPAHGASSTPTDKNYTFEQIQHQFRQLQQNYTTTSPVQKIITTEKGVALGFGSLARDAQSQSKELYLWGQQEQPDVKDVSDRLGFLNYITAELATTLSTKLNTARLPLKELRDNEVALAQKHSIHTGLEQQISRVENSKEKGNEKRLAELKEQLAKAKSDDEPAEKQHDILLRKALRESEQVKFQALREYGEKLALVAQAAESVLAVLPSIPPSSSQPYKAVQETGSIRASLQHALDHWQPGQTTLSAPADVILDRSNTGSFGETHSVELQKIETPEHQVITQPVGEGTVGSPGPDSSPTPKPAQIPVPVPIQELGSASSPPPSSLQTRSASVSSPLAASSTSPGVNPAVLNNEPAPIPSASPPPAADGKGKVPAVTPTVAETGVPVSGGPSGPGPSSGSLHEIRSSSSGLSQAASDVAVAPGPERSSTNQYESAEEEKKRLAREERERLLQGEKTSAESSDPRDDAPADDGDIPPPYQEL